jgi:pilus assembly protein CpaB
VKNRRALLFALILGFVAVFALAFYSDIVERSVKGKYEDTVVIVAKQDIPRYSKIDESMLEFQHVPKPFVQPLAVTDKEPEVAIGAMADATIKKGEQVTKTKLALAGEGGISPIIPPGYRACTIAVNEITGVAGLIRTGDAVDVIGTFHILGDKSKVANTVEAVTLFQGVSVLAVGRNYLFDRPVDTSKTGGSLIPGADRGTSFSNVTLQMSPRECMDLVVAQQVGELTLSLRSFIERFPGKGDPQLKERRSTTESVTGIKTPVEITKKPRWMELRGDQPSFVP